MADKLILTQPTDLTISTEAKAARILNELIQDSHRIATPKLGNLICPNCYRRLVRIGSLAIICACGQEVR